MSIVREGDAQVGLVSIFAAMTALAPAHLG